MEVNKYSGFSKMMIYNSVLIIFAIVNSFWFAVYIEIVTPKYGQLFAKYLSNHWYNAFIK